MHVMCNNGKQTSHIEPTSHKNYYLQLLKKHSRIHLIKSDCKSRWNANKLFLYTVMVQEGRFLLVHSQADDLS